MENNNFGQVKISNDVVATIAGLAALEVDLQIKYLKTMV